MGQGAPKGTALGWEASQLLTSKSGPVAMVTAEPGSGPRPPWGGPLAPGPPVLTVEPGESPGHGGAQGAPDCRGGVPGGVSVPRGPRGPTWHQVSTGGPKWKKGWPGRMAQQGRRCSWGSATLICLAVRRAAGGWQLWVPWQRRPGLREASGLPSGAGGVPCRPLGIRGWLCFL